MPHFIYTPVVFSKFLISYRCVDDCLAENEVRNIPLNLIIEERLVCLFCLSVSI